MRCKLTSLIWRNNDIALFGSDIQKQRNDVGISFPMFVFFRKTSRDHKPCSPPLDVPHPQQRLWASTGSARQFSVVDMFVFERKNTLGILDSKGGGSASVRSVRLNFVAKHRVSDFFDLHFVFNFFVPCSTSAHQNAHLHVLSLDS